MCIALVGVLLLHTEVHARGWSMYELSTRPWLYSLSQKYNKTIQALAQIPIQEFQAIKDMGFDIVWMMGVWELVTATFSPLTIPGKVWPSLRPDKPSITSRIRGDSPGIYRSRHYWSKLIGQYAKILQGVPMQWLITPAIQSWAAIRTF